jgi:transposase
LAETHLGASGLRTPKIGDIWKDSKGYFLVIDEHELSDYERKVNLYACEISLIDLQDGLPTFRWTINKEIMKGLVFIA